MSKNRKPIILCAGTNGCAVLFGYVDADPVPGEPVELHNARMILRWDAACCGLLGLAADGPKGDTRVTPTVKRTVETKWQEWVSVNRSAAKQIREWSC